MHTSHTQHPTQQALSAGFTLKPNCHACNMKAASPGAVRALQLPAHLLLRTLTMPAWGSSRDSMWQVKMQWLREEAAFMSVAAT